MHTYDIYSTPACGYCKQLKAVLHEMTLSYTNHDVTVSKKDLAEMQALTDGGMSVPVFVVDKGTAQQRVAQGFDDAKWLLDHSK